MPVASDGLVERFRMAIDCWQTGVALQRQRLVRLHPQASRHEIDALLNRWLQERPSAESGDGPEPGPR